MLGEVRFGRRGRVVYYNFNSVHEENDRVMFPCPPGLGGSEVRGVRGVR